MGYCFRVCFCLPGKGSLASDEEFIAFPARPVGIDLKLSSGPTGVTIAGSDRFSISGGAFDTADQAQRLAEEVRIALLRRAVQTRRGLDLGELSLKSFNISEYGKQFMAEALQVPAVQEDHLGVTIFTDNPRPQFLRMDMKGLVSTPAQSFVDDLANSIGKFKFASKRAEIASGIYAFSHFVGPAPARFLVLFVSLEALFETLPRSDDAQAHVQFLIEETQKSQLEKDEKDAISSVLKFQKMKSIAQTGRDLAAALLKGRKYASKEPDEFFRHIYGVRNSVVHKGEIDPKEIQELMGDMDSFVSDLLQLQYVEQ